MVDSVGRVPVPGKKGGKWVAASIVIVALIIAGGLVYLYYPYSPPIQGPDENQTYTEEQIDLIVDNNYPHVREQLLNDSEALTICLALTEKNIGMCNSLGNRDSINECKRNYNLILSYQNRCEELVTIDSWMDFESGFCEKVNSLFCDGLTGDTKLLCRYLVENNIDLCLDIPGSNYQGCSDFLNLYNSLKEMDNTYCNQIIEFDNKILCNSLIGGDCSESIDRLAKDMVYLDLSEKTNNADICNKITYDFIKNPCIAGKGLKGIG